MHSLSDLMNNMITMILMKLLHIGALYRIIEIIMSAIAMKVKIECITSLVFEFLDDTLNVFLNKVKNNKIDKNSISSNPATI